MDKLNGLGGMILSILHGINRVRKSLHVDTHTLRVGPDVVDITYKENKVIKSIK